MANIFYKITVNDMHVYAINRNGNIKDSITCTINNGYIESFSLNITNVQKYDNDELVRQIKEFTEKLVDDIRIAADIKNEILKLIDSLSNQLAGKNHPKKSIIRLIIERIPSLIKCSESLLNIWKVISDLISKVM